MNISNPNFRIRPILPQDNESVRNVILTVMSSFGCMGEGFSSSDPEVQNMYENYKDDRSEFYVLVSSQDNEVYGCGGIGPLAGCDETICELKKMYFLPEARGLGLGQRIIDKSIDKARSIGYQQCYLETLLTMTAANHLYQKNGFERLEAPMGATGHSGCDAYYLKQL